jgi:hypothetical protein
MLAYSKKLILLYMSKFIKFAAVTLAFGVILSSFLSFNFFSQNIKAQAAQLNTSDFTLPAGYSICAVQDNNQLNTGIKIASGTVLNPTITGTKYNLYAINSTLCNLATTQNSSAPFTFYSYSNHNTNLKINSLTPGNPPTFNVSVEYPNLSPIYSAPNNNNSKTFNLCVGSSPNPITFSIIDQDNDALIKNTPATFSSTSERSVSVEQGAGFVNYAVTPTQQFLSTPNDFTITTIAKEEITGNLDKILGFGTPTTNQSINFNSILCTSSSSTSLPISNSPKSSSSNSSLILSSNALNSSSGIITSSDLPSSVSSLSSSSKISSSSQTPNSLTSSSNLISSSSNDYSSIQSSVNSISSALSSSLLSNSSASSCTLPIPPNANTCLNNSSKSSSSISPDGVLVVSYSSISNSTQSSSSQKDSISSQSSITSDSSQNSSINSSSSSSTCNSSESNQNSNSSTSNYTNECSSESVVRSGGGNTTPTSGGVIFLSNLETISKTKPSDYFSIDDPYICGEAIQGQVFYDNLDNLDKVYLDLESTIDSNLVYTILPNVNSDGTYQYQTTIIEPGPYKIIYYGINKDGTKTPEESYMADIQPKENCIEDQNLYYLSRQSGVLDFTYSPIEAENISLEVLTKIAQAKQPKVFQSTNGISTELVRTGGEKTQSFVVIILAIITMMWMLQSYSFKNIFVKKTNQFFNSFIILSILTTSVSMSGIYLGGNILIQTQDQNKFILSKPVFALCLHSSSNKNKAFQNLTLPYL